MGLFDWLFGRQQQPRRHAERGATRPRPAGPRARGAAQNPDEQAIERYRYLLRTAPPETIEQAHAEAFAQLTPEQRRMVLAGLSREVPDEERQAVRDDDPRSLARLATRAEMQRPGTLERTFSGMAMPGIGMGGLMMGTFFSSFAGMIAASWVASQFFDDAGDDQGYDEGSAASEEAAAETGDDGVPGMEDPGAFDAGGDFGDFGGDFGGEF